MPSPIQLRQQEKREETLGSVREQAADGEVVIRPTAADERTRFRRRHPGVRRPVARRR